MIFLLVASYSILIIIFLAFMIFLINAKNIIVGLRTEVEQLRDDVKETQDLFRKQITGLLSNMERVVKK